METDPQTCVLASGPQGGRPPGDGCEVMKRGGDEGCTAEGAPADSRVLAVLAEADTGVVLPVLTFVWGGAASFEAGE